jgi:hypothetical protein
VALAFAGAGAKILGDALTDHPIELWSIGLLGGAAGGVVCIFVAFVRVLTKRQRQQRPPSASAHLLPPGDLAEVGDENGEDETRALQRAFLAATAAAYELHARNAEEKKRLTVAQQWLILGAALTLFCGGVYTWLRPHALSSQAPPAGKSWGR